MLCSVKNNSDYYLSIHFFSEKNNYLISTAGSNYPSDFYDKECIDQFMQNSKKSYIALHSPGVLTVCYAFIHEGAIFFNINFEKIFTLINGYSSYENSFFVITDENGKTVLSTCEEIIPADKALDTEKLKSVCLYSKAGINYGGMTLFHCIPKSEYISLLTTPLKTSLLFLMLSVLMMLIITFISSYKLYESIAQLVSLSDSDAHAKNDSNEIATLTNFIIKNTEYSKNLEKELSKKIASMHRSQSIALQTQLNPHFLFNTLNLISCYVLEKDYEDTPVTVMIDNLSEILRYALDTDHYLVSVKQELNIAKKYIEIENLKHQNKINVSIYTDPVLESSKTLKMILQPVLENAFKYGVLKLRNKAPKITVAVHRQNQNIIFEISNNGPEIPPERLAEIKSDMEKCEILQTHIGLRNLQSCIWLIFGKAYGCSITSDKELTTVTIKLPYIHESE